MTLKNKSVNKPARSPVRRGRVLTADVGEGYTGRWVNEMPGSVEAFEEAGWEIVRSPTADTSDSSISKVSGVGSAVERIVNTKPDARAHKAVLMRIKTEYYEEAQKEKYKELDRVESSIDPKNDKDPNFYGSMEKY